MKDLQRIYENVKMNLVGGMNLGFEALDREIQKQTMLIQEKDKKIEALEAKIKELEKK